MQEIARLIREESPSVEDIWSSEGFLLIRLKIGVDVQRALDAVLAIHRAQAAFSESVDYCIIPFEAFLEEETVDSVRPLSKWTLEPEVSAETVPVNGNALRASLSKMERL